MLRIFYSFLFCFFISSQLFPQGFYKDVFMDGGCDLSFFDVPAITTLGLSLEYMGTENNEVQNSRIIQNEYDANGVLLYPDGQPRFKVFYSHGGSSLNHGLSLGETGRQRIRDFYYNGGSYTGNCAGSALSSISRDATGTMPQYYGIWPGRIERVTIGPYDNIAVTIPDDSPYLLYRTFDNNVIEGLYFYFSNYARENLDYPPQTQVCTRYDTPGFLINGMIQSWAYKENENTGRVVVMGCHAEFADRGDRLRLTEAMFLHALDGVGSPNLKAELLNGQLRQMDKSTEENDPAYTKIGDKQYHHFKINIPYDASTFSVNLEGQAGYDFNLYLNRGDFAFENQCNQSDTNFGAAKNITVDFPEPGEWYIGVELENTVDAASDGFTFTYSGDLSVLNGIQYSIEANWDGTTNVIEDVPLDFQLSQNYPNPFNPSTNIDYTIANSAFVRLEIYNSLGKKIRSLVERYESAGTHTTIWDGRDEAGNRCSSGLYFYRIATDNYSKTKQMLLLK